jgi:hypothetical protein
MHEFLFYISIKLIILSGGYCMQHATCDTTHDSLVELIVLAGWQQQQRKQLI